MLEDMVAPLGVEVLCLPDIKIVDNEKGMVPLPCVGRQSLSVQAVLEARKSEITEFLARARASLPLAL